MESIANSSSEEDRDARNELWNQLVASLREKLRTLETEGRVQNPKLKEPFLNEFLATTEGGFISVWLHVEDGSGSWNQVAPVDECEQWSITPDGIAELSGRLMSVHELADAFASKLIVRDR